MCRRGGSDHSYETRVVRGGEPQLHSLNRGHPPTTPLRMPERKECVKQIFGNSKLLHYNFYGELTIAREPVFTANNFRLCIPKKT